jgi:integrase
LAEGIPITEVSRWLGHKSIEATHQIYTKSRELHQPGEKLQVSSSQDRRNGVPPIPVPVL